MVSKRSSRKARKPQRKTHTSQHGRGGSSLDARLKAPPGAGGPIRNIHPSARVLQGLIPPLNAVSVKSGIVSRSGMPFLGAKRLPGFRWDVPAPDPSLGTVLWATLGFDWVFYSWRSNYPKNDGDQKIRFNGSLQWIWLLTGHPDIFPAAPIFLTDGGLYSFYMDLAPGDAGFDGLAHASPFRLLLVPTGQDGRVDDQPAAAIARHEPKRRPDAVVCIGHSEPGRRRHHQRRPQCVVLLICIRRRGGSMASEHALALSNS